MGAWGSSFNLVSGTGRNKAGGVGSWGSTSITTSKDQVASRSFSGPHATENSMGCHSIMKLSGFSFLRKALVELDSCLCWSWKAEMCHNLAVPNLTKPHPLSYVDGYSQGLDYHLPRWSLHPSLAPCHRVLT